MAEATMAIKIDTVLCERPQVHLVTSSPAVSLENTVIKDAYNEMYVQCVDSVPPPI